MLDLTRYAVRAQCNIVPTDGMIWRSIRNKDIYWNIHDFLWRCLHDSYKCGVYWRNIPGFEQFATCHFCGADENVEHILVDDLASILIWDLCTELWEMKHQKMPALSIGSILGSALRMHEASRLFIILVTESAHLIWKLRCIHNKWVTLINSRLRFDQLLTDTSCYGNCALNAKTILRTWDGVLMDKLNLPENWIWQSGVLVGIGTLCPLGRNR
ncbi:hypothetical protein B0H14DRAFT_3101974 [Mycena olivaceomarginata]|nr:hypothetical protein B0H14DRAFT_3101974 [Mycena olivaceomarginata]